MEIDIINEIAKEESRTQTSEKLIENEINWVSGESWDWDLCKGYSKKIWGHRTEYIESPIKWFFLAHAKDKIKGKPQLLQNTTVRLPLVRMAIRKTVDEGTKEEKEIQSFYFFDDRFDKRYDGLQKDSFAMDFYKYQIITPDDKEVYVFSKEKLPSETCLIEGMEVQMDDFSEMSRTMKLPSISRIFFAKEVKPAVKTLPKKELVDFAKSKKLRINDWLNHLAYHPFGTFNSFPIESELLHAAQMLCGKLDGYPLHVCYVGTQGTRKTMGKGETTEFKFGDEKIIIDSGNSRLKGLGASYKGTITSPGYLAKQDRIAIVDEIGKMIEAEINKTGGTNILGDLNAIMEHKERKVVSGNTSESNMKPTAKFIMITNPVSYRKTIYDHVGLIDSTFMSRALWWIQDQREVEFVLKWGILRTPKDIDKSIDDWMEPQKTETSIYLLMIDRYYSLWKKSFGVSSSSSIQDMVDDEEKRNLNSKNLYFNDEIKKPNLNIFKYLNNDFLNKFKDLNFEDLNLNQEIDRDSFLTIYDSCYSFLSQIDDSKIQEIVDLITLKSKEPMTGVWRPRGFHHTYLLVDGLCKLRCLFKDHDPEFVSKPEDYEIAEKILCRMVEGWETNLQPKEGFK
jgi:hypothetical protein